MAVSRRITLRWSVSGSTSETISIVLPATVAQGSIIPFDGFWTGIMPAVLQYSIDGGISWIAATSFQAANDGTFQGNGPVATTLGTLNLIFRDRDRPLVTAQASTTVVAIGQVLTLAAIANTIVGQAATLSGTWNGTTPPGLQYSLDGLVWNTVAAFSAGTNGTWIGTGNVPGAPGQFLVRVRRTDQTSVISNAVSYTAVFGDALALNTPTPINAGDNVALTGTWTGTKPSALEYSLNGGSSWPGLITALIVNDNGNTTGSWSGTGPVFATGGTFFIRVRNVAANQIVSASVQVTVATPAITLNTPASVIAGTAFSLSGTWAARRPTAMDYTTDGGTTWTAVASFTSTSTSPGTWTGIGPTPGVAGNTNIQVRDQNNTGTQSAQVVGVATSGATDALTLDVPAPVGVGTPFALGGTWTNTKPSALDYSTDGGSTWTAVTNYVGLGVSVSGGWTGTGPTPSVVGNTSIKVRDHNATSVQSGTVTAVAIAVTLTLDAIPSISLGQAVAFTGGWAGRMPAALDWSADNGATWTALVSPTINSNNTWSATGPVPAAAQTFTYMVRDHDHIGVVSGPQDVVVTNIEVITLATPATTTVNNPVALSGTWSGVRPGASLVYTTDNFATAFQNTTNYVRSADNAAHTGTWTATGPTPIVAGNLSIRVMDGTNPAAKSNAVTAVVVASGPQPAAVSLNPISSVVVANPVQLSGTWTTTQPTAMDYTTNSGGAWTPITSFSALAGGTWSGVGPTPLAAGTLNVQVRDHNATGVTSGTQPVTVTAAPTPASLTVTPPAAVTQGSIVPLNGGWVTTKPTAMDYTLDNGTTWIAIGTFATTGTTGSGNWSGNGPTPSSSGTLSIRVRDHNAQSVQAGPVNATVNPSSGGGGSTTGIQALRAREFTDSLGVNIHFDSSTTIPGVKTAATLGRGDGGAKTIAAMQSIGITKYRTGWFWPQPGPYADDQVVTNFDNAGLKLTLYPIQDGSRNVQSVATQIAFMKRHNLAAFEGGNEVDLFPLRYNVGGVQYTDVAGNGPFPATTHVQLDVYTAMKADPATRNLPVVMPTSGYGDSAHYTKIRDSAGAGHDWGDRCTDVNAHNYTPGDVHYTGSTNYLQNNYNAAKLLLPSPVRYVTTEWGNNTATGGGANWVSEAAQNKLDWAGWVAQFMFGIREMYRYELWDFGTSLSSAGDNWGFFRHDASSTAKPIVATFTNVFTILKDNGSQAFTPQKLNYSFTNMPTGNATFGQGKAITLQASDGSFYLIVYVAKSIWNTGSKSLTNNTASTVTLNLTTAAPVSYFDPLLGAAARSTSGTAVTSFNFSLNDTPIILKVGAVSTGGGVTPLFSMPTWPTPRAITPTASSLAAGRLAEVTIGPGGTVANWDTAMVPGAGTIPSLPMVADGGRVKFLPNVDGSNVPIPYDINVHGDVRPTFFPNGIEICGVQGQATKTMMVSSTALTLGKALFAIYVDAYIHDLSFMNVGNPNLADGLGTNSGFSSYATGTAPIWFYHQEALGSGYPNRTLNIERVAIDGCMMGVFSPQDNLPGNGWSVFLTDCDFGKNNPNGFGLDYLAHDTYVGAKMYVNRCNFYGPKWGVPLKARSDGIYVKDSILYRRTNRWVDMPQGGELYFQNTQFRVHPLAQSPLVPGTTDTVLHVFEYGALDFANGQTAVVVFDSCDIWGARSGAATAQPSLGEDFMLGVNDGSTKIVFQNCRQHWAQDPTTVGEPFFTTVGLVNHSSTGATSIDGFVNGLVFRRPSNQAFEPFPALPPSRLV